MMVSELRSALRFRHRRLHAGLVVLLVAIAVALSTTAFAVLHGVILQPLPYRDADRLVHVWSVAERWQIDEYPFSWPNFQDYARDAGSFEGLAAGRARSFTVQSGAEPRSIPGARVTPNFLSVLGLTPELGSDFRAGSSPLTPERRDEVLVGHRLWMEELGGDPDIIGSPLRLDGVPHTVIGILPPELRYPQADTQLLVPFWPEGVEEARAFHFLRVIGRLADGSTLEATGAELRGIAERLAAEYPGASGELSARLVPLRDQIVGDSPQSLSGIYAAIQLLFAIACGNIAGVMLVAGVARRRELALRLALGASRGRLARQLLTEHLLLAAAGGAIGLLAAWGAVNWLKGLDSTLLPRAYELSLGGAAAGYAAAATAAAVLLSGAVPIALACRGRALEVARGAAGTSGALRAQRALVAGQIAVTLVLLFCGAVLGRSVQALSQVDPGFSSAGAIAAEVALAPTDYGDPAAQSRYVRRALLALEGAGGARAAGAISRRPFSEGNSTLTAFRPEQAGESGLANANYRVVTPDLFASVGVSLIDGRSFTWSDDGSAARAVIVDQTLADLLWPGRTAIGQVMRLGAIPEEWRVVGIAPPLRLLGLDTEPGYTVYVPLEQNPFVAAFRTPTFVLRTTAPVEAVLPRVRDALQEVDPRQAVLDPRPLAAAVDDWLGSRRTVGRLVGVAGALALLLAAVGLYATLSFAVRQRRGELAVRAALGAAPGRLLRGALLRGLRDVLIGLSLGLAACWLVGRWLAAQVYGMDLIGLEALAGATLLLVVAATLAALPPSLRAAREDPALVLRRSD